MKRILFILIVALTAIAASAKEPQLAGPALFTEKIMRDPHVVATIVNSSGNYYRGLEVNNDKALAAKVEAAVKADQKIAYNVVENYNRGSYTMILNINRKGHLVNVGWTKTSDSSCSYFIQSESREALE